MLTKKLVSGVLGLISTPACSSVARSSSENPSSPTPVVVNLSPSSGPLLNSPEILAVVLS